MISDKTVVALKTGDGPGLSEEEIHEIARMRLKSNKNAQDDELNRNRELAYYYYKGAAPGPSDAHESTAVSADVSDTIEWVLPSVLKPLIESPDVVRFDPVSADDTEQAAIESDYVHHTLMKKCNGFLKLYCHIKDALMLKTGVFCTYWDEALRQQKEEYRDLTEAELADLLFPSDGSKVRLISSSEREEPLVDVMTGQPLPPPTPDAPAPSQTLYDVAVRRFYPNGRAVIENCVPESFQVDFDHDSIDLADARWCDYRVVKTRSYLVSLGYDEDKIDEIPTDIPRSEDNEVRWAREDVERSANQMDDDVTQDESQKQYVIHRSFMHIDADQDGVDEYYLVVLGGDDGEVLLDYYEVPENPFSASTPFIAAHKFYGLSLFDKVKRLADHKSKVLRILEDNLDLTNNPTKKVTQGAAVLDDLLSRRVGALWRVDDQTAVTEVPTQPVGAQAQQLLDYYDKMRSERTGTDPNAQAIVNNLPDESMNHAVERVLSMKEELVGMLIRVFAETGVKDMMCKLRGVLMRNLDQDELVQLRNKWATVNPGNWVERTDSTVVVGLGAGDKLQKSNGLQMVFGLQQQAIQGGLMGILVSPERIAHTVSEMVRVQGLGDPDDFFLSPSYLLDPRNQDTSRFQEMVRAQQLQQKQQQAAQAQQEAQLQMQREQLQMQREQLQVAQQEKQALFDLQMKIARMQEETKRMDSAFEEKTAMSDQMSEMRRFQEKMELEWAKLRQETRETMAKLAIEASKTGSAE
jgi:hypothetical protein